MSSDGNWSYSTARLSLELTNSRPFSKAPENAGDRPRIEITFTRPSGPRCPVTPGRRASASAILESGSLPSSSADTTSTIESDSRLTATESSILRRIPVTTTVSTFCVAGVAASFFAASFLVTSCLAASCGAGSACCACALMAKIAAAHAAAKGLSLNSKWFTTPPLPTFFI